MLGRTDRYERFLRVAWALEQAALLGALAVLVWRAPRLARGTGLGPIGAGVIVGMVMLVVVWAVELPFGLAVQWWDRRHGLSHLDYLESILAPWAELGGSVVFAMFTIVLVMWLARRLGRAWWVAGGPAFVAIAVLFAFVAPYLLAPTVEPVRDPALRAEIGVLEREIGTGEIRVDVYPAGEETTVANAFAAGLGPTTRVVLFDTLLDGRFAFGEVRFVAAHELGHVARDHLWKGLAWYALFALPGAFLIAWVTEWRGGLGDPALVPLGALVLVVLQLVLLPVGSAITRRYEGEADWIALEATRDPGSARRLFVRFAPTSLEQPRPPGWSHVLLDSHPTLMQRIAMVEAWAAREP